MDLGFGVDGALVVGGDPNARMLTILARSIARYMAAEQAN